MTSKNEITGDSIASKANNDLYRENWEKIFGKKKVDSSSDKHESDMAVNNDSEKNMDTDKTKEQP